MKKAFTIIELIFVIIILGILAAIAIPKLNASRADAQISQTLANLKIAIGDISSYMLKNGTLGPSSIMSNVADLENADLSKLGANEDLAFKVGNDDKCISLYFVQDAEVLLFGIAYEGGTSKSLLQAIATARKKLNEKPEDASLASSLANANDALYKQNFTTTSTSTVCKSLLANHSFENLARRAYILNGG